jgi:hypothetical protein
MKITPTVQYTVVCQKGAPQLSCLSTRTIGIQQRIQTLKHSTAYFLCVRPDHWMVLGRSLIPV